MKKLSQAKLLAEWLREIGVDFVSLPDKKNEKLSDPAGAETLDDIRQGLAKCGNCALRETRKTIVFGTGNPDAQLMFIGEGPGAEEDKKGEPFVGAAGKRLDLWIKFIGLKREDVYIANIVKCRPPGNRPPNLEEARLCMPYLVRQIKAVRPQLICTLGLSALNYMLGLDERMTKVRGIWHEWNGIPLLPTYHPAFILRKPPKEEEVFEDLKKLASRFSLLGRK
ncbi:MAG: uracil-DNA glycosylase [Syntrophorhabdaceae bacterium]|nr:uracil-DNA glycosylase [Syntrophorhabdaceae bacterium]